MGQKKKYQRITTVANAKAEASKAMAERAAEKAFPEQKGTVMGKGSLRVTKWLSSTPVIGVCNSCGKEFKVPMTALTKTKDAQINLQQQFDQHKCGVAPGSATGDAST